VDPPGAKGPRPSGSVNDSERAPNRMSPACVRPGRMLEILLTSEVRVTRWLVGYAGPLTLPPDGADRQVNNGFLASPKLAAPSTVRPR
jgi:hypothetical protein